MDKVSRVLDLDLELRDRSGLVPFTRTLDKVSRFLDLDLELRDKSG